MGECRYMINSEGNDFYCLNVWYYEMVGAVLQLQHDGS